MTCNVEIPSIKSEVLDHDALVQLSASECDNDGQPEMVRLTPKQIFHFWLSVVVTVVRRHFHLARSGQNPRFAVVPNFDSISLQVVLAAMLLFPVWGYRSLSQTPEHTSSSSP